MLKDILIIIHLIDDFLDDEFPFTLPLIIVWVFVSLPFRILSIGYKLYEVLR
jgi:hypothetical protein